MFCVCYDLGMNHCKLCDENIPEKRQFCSKSCAAKARDNSAMNSPEANKKKSVYMKTAPTNVKNYQSQRWTAEEKQRWSAVAKVSTFNIGNWAVTHTAELISRGRITAKAMSDAIVSQPAKLKARNKAISNGQKRAWHIDSPLRKKRLEVSLKNLGSGFGKRTMYNGVNFRSRLEAAAAQCFDTLGWTWDYEPRWITYWSGTYEHQYLPDFYIHDLDAYIEVKPSFRTNDVEVQAKLTACEKQGLLIGLCTEKDLQALRDDK